MIKRWMAPGILVWLVLALLLAAILAGLLTHDPAQALTPADGVEFCMRVLGETRDWCEG